MDKQLEVIAKSYDRGIDLGKKGINLYDELPSHITSHKDYPEFAKLMDDESSSDSKRQDVKDFLNPSKQTKFVDLGCCLNLMFNNYDQWESLYHGVDISSKTIQLLEEIVAKRDLKIGSLYCGSMHDTPYEDRYFDIGACIGSFEYFEKDFIKEALDEVERILKPKARLVLDIPDLPSPVFGIMKMVEEHMGRPDKFDLSEEEFNQLIEDSFDIVGTTKVAGMIQYFLVKK